MDSCRRPSDTTPIPLTAYAAWPSPQKGTAPLDVDQEATNVGENLGVGEIAPYLAIS
jgi:hypothetical protein